MKESTFYKLLFVITAVCLLLTAAHLCYAVYAYQHCSIIQFIAKEPW